MGRASQCIYYFVGNERRCDERLAQGFSAGKAFRRHAREDVEAFGFAEGCFRHEFAAEAGERDALSGIAVRKENAVSQPPEMGHARAGDTHGPAPGVFSGNALECRIDVQHARPHETSDVARWPEIALAPGEEQAAVGALAVVVENMAGVRN